MEPKYNEEVYTVACDECGATKGKPCVYMPLVNQGDEHYHRSVYVKSRMALTGTPTKRAHNARYHRLWRRQKKRSATLLSEPEAPDPHYVETVYLHRQFDLVEYENIRNWLRENASIFWEL